MKDLVTAFRKNSPNSGIANAKAFSFPRVYLKIRNKQPAFLYKQSNEQYGRARLASVELRCTGAHWVWPTMLILNL